VIEAAHEANDLFVNFGVFVVLNFELKLEGKAVKSRFFDNTAGRT
jgi:putative aminopeptidase FrvX